MTNSVMFLRARRMFADVRRESEMSVRAEAGGERAAANGEAYRGRLGEIHRVSYISGR